MEKEHFYFKNTQEWREWLHKNHASYTGTGIYLIFYKVNSEQASMRWEEAVQVALCYGWIDSTVKRIDDEQRKQLFTPRKKNSGWSRLNKSYIEKLIQNNLMHESGLESIKIAKSNGSWTVLDAVENLEVPIDLQELFDKDVIAFNNYTNFSPSYRKNYLYWLNQAKKEATRQSRISEILRLCRLNIKQK
jgi:uncharacterized protein YdeI (YjbR/CyaY-like superfamily)